MAKAAEQRADKYKNYGTLPEKNYNDLIVNKLIFSYQKFKINT